MAANSDPHPKSDTPSESRALPLLENHTSVFVMKGLCPMRPFASTICAARRNILGCLLAVLVAACAMSQQQEVDLGANAAAQVSAELPLIHDAAVVSYINTTRATSSRRSPTHRNLTWHFTVVDSKEVNAFALPGGWVYVNRGLIERATNMSELAGVIGHEIGHVTRRHSVQQLQQARRGQRRSWRCCAH